MTFETLKFSSLKVLVFVAICVFVECFAFDRSTTFSQNCLEEKPLTQLQLVNTLINQYVY